MDGLKLVEYEDINTTEKYYVKELRHGPYEYENHEQFDHVVKKGNYDNGLKHGKWIRDDWNDDYGTSSFKTTMYHYGNKLYTYTSDCEGKLMIRGGSYYFGKKRGPWVENFKYHTYVGKYKDGKPVSKWFGCHLHSITLEEFVANKGDLKFFLSRVWTHHMTIDCDDNFKMTEHIKYSDDSNLRSLNDFIYAINHQT